MFPVQNEYHLSLLMHHFLSRLPKTCKLYVTADFTATCRAFLVVQESRFLLVRRLPTTIAPSYRV
jgi:hypothetical protein